MAKFTLTTIKKRLKLTNQHVIVIGPYKGSDAPLPCKCKICKRKWNPSWSTLRRGCGCPKCGKERADNKGKLNPFDVKKRLKAMSPTIEIIGAYINSASPLPCLCIKCDHKWSPTWSDLSRGHGCPNCGIERQAQSLRLSTSEVTKKLTQINSGIEIVGTYVDSGSPLGCRCKKCNHKWSPSWAALQQGQGCPKCFRTREKLTNEELITKLKLINPNIQVLGHYTGRHRPLKCKCAACGHVWSPTWHFLQRGVGCQKCRRDSSNFETEVRKTLEKLTGAKFTKCRPNFTKGMGKTPLELDCFNERLKLAAEAQGPHHYKPTYWTKFSLRKLRQQQRRDMRKRMACYRHSIRFIAIPYWIRNVEVYLRNRLLKFGVLKQIHKDCS